MIKKIIMAGLIFQTIEASDFFEMIKEKPRVERKKLCLEKMEETKDTKPKIAYRSANCLLYNGYGDLAIPLFTLYLNNGYNKKYFNKRIGYGWLHSANWYKIDGNILGEMTEGKGIYQWTIDEINKEAHKNREKYNITLEKLLKSDIKMYSRSGKITKKEQSEIKKCKKIKIEINGVQCEFTNKVFSNCKEVEEKDFKFKCLEYKGME